MLDWLIFAGVFLLVLDKILIPWWVAIWEDIDQEKRLEEASAWRTQEWESKKLKR